MALKKRIYGTLQLGVSYVSGPFGGMIQVKRVGNETSRGRTDFDIVTNESSLLYLTFHRKYHIPFLRDHENVDLEALDELVAELDNGKIVDVIGRKKVFLFSDLYLSSPETDNKGGYTMGVIYVDCIPKYEFDTVHHPYATDKIGFQRFGSSENG